jgi:GGDEF domain-containing protein
MLRDAVAATVLPEGCPGPLSASVGCAIFPRDSTTAESLRNLADARMYEEKRAIASDALRRGGRYDGSGMEGLRTEER